VLFFGMEFTFEIFGASPARSNTGTFSTASGAATGRRIFGGVPSS
jgi:hypothetical protein